MPKVSIILTSFNHEKYLREAIDSVLNQTFSDFELIILDDCSSDNSWELINQYTDPRIKGFHSEEQGQVVLQVNNAISNLATGEYIAIHHSDDVWELDKLEKQVAFLDMHPEIGAVFTNTLAITEDSSPLRNEEHPYYKIFDRPNRNRHEWLRFFFIIGSALCHPSVLIRKACYVDCGLYCYGMAQLPDFDMWIRLCMKYEIHVLPEKLVKFRVRDNEANSSGNRPDTRNRLQYEFYKVLQNFRQLDNIEDLIKVFPTAGQYDRNEETDLGFVLAMMALEQKDFPYKQLFGQELFFEAISDPKRSITIKRLYNFDHRSFIALTGQHDVFSQEALAHQHKRIVNLSEVVETRDKQVIDLSQVVEVRDKQIVDLCQVVETRDKQIVDLNQVVEVRDRQIFDLNQVLEARDEQIVGLNQSAAEKEGQITNLNQIIAMRNEQIAALYSSLSWRITRPLRFILRIF